MSKQSARFRAIKSGDKTFIRSYQKKEVVENERNLAYDIKSQLPEGFIPYDKPLWISATFVFPIPKSMKKSLIKHIEAGGIVYKTTKPDLIDNLMKQIGDSMNGIVFIDDARICQVKDTSKIYGLVPRIIIELGELNETE